MLMACEESSKYERFGLIRRNPKKVKLETVLEKRKELMVKFGTDRIGKIKTHKKPSHQSKEFYKMTPVNHVGPFLAGRAPPGRLRN